VIGPSRIALSGALDPSVVVPVSEVLPSDEVHGSIPADATAALEASHAHVLSLAVPGSVHPLKSENAGVTAAVGRSDEFGTRAGVPTARFISAGGSASSVLKGSKVEVEESVWLSVSKSFDGTGDLAGYSGVSQNTGGLGTGALLLGIGVAILALVGVLILFVILKRRDKTATAVPDGDGDDGTTVTTFRDDDEDEMECVNPLMSDDGGEVFNLSGGDEAGGRP
jgi:hypothetical protein